LIRLKAELFSDLNGTVEGLRRALQNAIELEHATIPTYLYALYSIKPLANPEIARLIKSIVLEEMLHMSLDCNILNAVGGTPRIDDPCFIPKYPGPLPGGVESDLIVPLAPLSKQLVKDVFMVIEEPEDPQHYPVLKAAMGEPAKQETIGQFYAGIADQIRELSKQGNIFTGNPDKQLKAGFRPLQKIDVHDTDSALAAIDLIVEQGEGTKVSPLDPEHELAHYYKYSEIYYGKKLIPNPHHGPGEPDYAYGGHRIHFDPAGVWPTITNPNRTSYDPGSRAFQLNEDFNGSYTALLKSLQAVFSGQPDRLGPAITLMEAMKEQALTLMSTEVVPGQTAGPTFDYTPGKH
jgi:hypothetical protein